MLKRSISQDSPALQVDAIFIYFPSAHVFRANPSTTTIVLTVGLKYAREIALLRTLRASHGTCGMRHN